jgi:hypothetical protein
MKNQKQNLLKIAEKNKQQKVKLANILALGIKK